MIEADKLPIQGGQWIDCYNQRVDLIAGTIKARIDGNNLYYIMCYERQDNQP